MNDQSTNPTKMRRKKTLGDVQERVDALKNKARAIEDKQQSELEGNHTVNPGGIKQFKSIVNEETSESASCDTNTESFIRQMEAGTPQAIRNKPMMMKPSRKGKVIAEGVTLRSVSDNNSSIKGMRK